jgi:alpha-tubulin suppressor-like RCC1 family protein
VSSDNFSSCVKMSSEPASSNSNKTFTLDPYDNLTAGTTYKTRVTTGVKDTAGNAMSSQYETSSGFTTSSSSSSASSKTAISATGWFTCALLDNASVKCWGANGVGQLGIDNTTDMGDNTGEMAALPSINLGTGRTATAIAAGNFHTCSLLDNASVKCWGYNYGGLLGLDSTRNKGDGSSGDTMTDLPSINLGTGRTATAIAAGGYHNCAILDNSAVKCWGTNTTGQLGIDNTNNMGDDTGEMAVLPSINLGTGRTATAIDAGDFHSCALLDNASVKCWGKNDYGQLGIDSTRNKGDGSSGDTMTDLPSIDLGTGRTATAIAAGNFHSCALLDNASVKCWGKNDYGQLGIDNNTTMGDNSSEMAVLPSIDL